MSESIGVGGHEYSIPEREAHVADGIGGSIEDANNVVSSEILKDGVVVDTHSATDAGASVAVFEDAGGSNLAHVLEKSSVDCGAFDPQVVEATVAITCENDVIVVSAPTVTAATDITVAPDVAACLEVEADGASEETESDDLGMATHQIGKRFLICYWRLHTPVLT